MRLFVDFTKSTKVRKPPALGHLLIPGTSSPAHLRENVASAALTLFDEDLATLNRIAEQP